MVNVLKRLEKEPLCSHEKEIKAQIRGENEEERIVTLAGQLWRYA